MKLPSWKQRPQLANLRKELDGLWSQIFAQEEDESEAHPKVFSEGSMPALNVAEDPEAYSISVELPGLRREDIEIQLMGNQLVISGERRWEAEQEDKEFHRIESHFGSFRRSVSLPQGLRTDPEGISAVYENGMLEIHIPKVEPTPVVKIPVKGS